jgi:hypothetical protein
MLQKEEYITHDFKLPNHSNELSKATDFIEKLKLKIEKLKAEKSIDGNVHTTVYEEVIRVLDYVGRLSMPAFEIEEPMREMYIMQYKHSPLLAKKLWIDHYEKIHHPYTLLKNRCFRLLDELDTMYFKKFKKQPPNWNY